MDTLNAKPMLLKQVNLSLIRRAIKTKYTATRAEIVSETRISSTTVRSLLTQMLENGEIERIGYDESSGGRKAQRYRFKPDRYHGAALCISGSQLHCLLVNVCGEVVDAVRHEITDNHLEPLIYRILDEMTDRKEIKSIGLGVPGIVEGGSFWRKHPETGKLLQTDIGDALSARYGVPIVLENDLNATAIGFGHCYEKKYPGENPENTNMAYLYFESGCISAGFISGGRVIRGCSNYAGELGLIPADGDKTLDEYMSGRPDDIQYTDMVVKIIGWICGILNPRYVALGGSDLREDCVGAIGDGLLSVLPKHMCAEILYSPDMWHDYYEGMAYLTAGRMFDGYGSLSTVHLLHST